MILKMRKLEAFWMGLIFSVFSTGFAFACEQFESGLTFYYQQEYKKAADLWLQCLDSKEKPSFSLHYNLGNAFYKMGSYGESRLHFEKARRLSPFDEELVFNYAMTISKLKDEEEGFGPPDPAFLMRFWYGFLALGPLFSFCFMFRAKLTKWPWLLILVFCFFSVTYFSSVLFDSASYGVILQKDQDVYSNRNSSSAKIASLHEGKSLKILSMDEEWILAEFKPGVRGWVPRQVVGVI